MTKIVVSAVTCSWEIITLKPLRQEHFGRHFFDILREIEDILRKNSTIISSIVKNTNDYLQKIFRVCRKYTDSVTKPLKRYLLETGTAFAV